MRRKHDRRASAWAASWGDPAPVARPAHEAVVAGLPGAIARRHVTPGRTGALAPDDAVDDAAVLGVGMATVGIGRQMRFKLPPLLLG